MSDDKKSNDTAAPADPDISDAAEVSEANPAKAIELPLEDGDGNGQPI